MESASSRALTVFQLLTINRIASPKVPSVYKRTPVSVLGETVTNGRRERARCNENGENVSDHMG